MPLSDMLHHEDSPQTASHTAPPAGWKIPAFDPGKHAKSQPRFQWWSWHPLYPRWSRSCFGGDTIEEAFTALAKPFACKLAAYHNKLIREADGHFDEVHDAPCKEMDEWPAPDSSNASREFPGASPGKTPRDCSALPTIGESK